jgi:hypothetical protein
VNESATTIDATSDDSEQTFEWSIRPSVGRPGAMFFAVSTILIMSSLIGVMGGDWIWGALSVVLLFLTSSRFFLTSRVSISREGIRAEFPLRTRFLTWGEIEKIRHDGSAALVRIRKRRWRRPEYTLLFGEAAAGAIESLIRFSPPGVTEEVSS